jgi:hypothetical protein
MREASADDGFAARKGHDDEAVDSLKCTPGAPPVTPAPATTSDSSSSILPAHDPLGEPSRRECGDVASYQVNERAVARARQLVESRQYVLESDWGDVQPRAADENAYLESHSWDEYAEWHLGLTQGATDETKARYAFVYGDFRRIHRSGVIACHYRAAEWRHKEIELAAHDLLQLLDSTRA